MIISVEENGSVGPASLYTGGWDRPPSRSKVDQDKFNLVCNLLQAGERLLGAIKNGQALLTLAKKSSV
jgi:hypothetical protein